ncbi:uncharacterized protein N7515_006258 [Penicillium bovifimosum]|uniref:Uncharacterized protein n=1 Tax=Penicillium bovifimosum TaxID=126998 RepID=A0A9W9L0L4_9EURO|nr:uncharacterized protein N7515_006258 [Penicillium bovifimosum]KAJ5130219.1 hypothetical protein N7515_006258 [Penicillium bovifimosum]
MTSTEAHQTITNQTLPTSMNPFESDDSNTLNTSDTSQSIKPPANGPAFTVDFTWKKWKGMVSDANKPGSDPLYTIHFPFNVFTKYAATLVFKRNPSEEVIGSGMINAVSINADYELHGQKAHLLAQKRWKTVYTHRSLNFSDTDSPVTMTWTSDCGFKSWDFVCVDEQQMPVARFAANCWALTKVGKIEFIGPKAESRAAQEEIMVTGITLFYCMMLRANSIFNFFGAVFARPGHKQHIEPMPKDMAS